MRLSTEDLLKIKITIGLLVVLLS